MSSDIPNTKDEAGHVVKQGLCVDVDGGIFQEAKTAPARKKAAEGDVMSKGDLGEMEYKELGGELGN